MNIYLGTYLIGCLINVIILLLIYFFDNEGLNETIDKLSNENYLDRRFVYKIFLIIGILMSWIIVIGCIDAIINDIQKMNTKEHE